MRRLILCRPWDEDKEKRVARGASSIELSARLTKGKTGRASISISPFRLFVCLYAAAFPILVYEGREADAIRTLGYSVMFAALALATKMLCKTDPERPRAGRNLPLQYATIGAAMIVTALVSVHFGSEDARPSDAMQAIYSTGCWQFFVEVCAVFVILRVLKLRGVDLGLRAWATGGLWVAIIWITTAVGFLSRDVIHGAIASDEACRQCVENVFRNGFSEEFLFRGVLLSRLRLVLSDQWALFAQALLFGVWHYGTDVRAANGNLIVTACFMITVQAVFGYALGYLALRTRSIAAGAAFHAIADATDII